MINELQRLFYLMLTQFRLIFAYWLAGMLLGAFISTYGSQYVGKLAHKLSSRKAGVPAMLVMACLGAVSPLCMYGTIPIIAALGKKDVPQELLAVFMVSSILINPNLFVVSFALGVPLAMLRLLAAIAGGLAAGLLARLFFVRQPLFVYERFEHFKGRKPKERTFSAFVQSFHRTVVTTTPYMLVGIAMTALVDRYFPAEWMGSFFGMSKVMEVFIMTTMGVPLYVCGGGTVPLIAALLDSGMSYGSAVAFMVSGPATKLNNLSAVKMVLGKRNFIIYIVFSMVYAIAAGLIVDLIYSLL